MQKEDRKDDRVRMQGNEQRKTIDKRNRGTSDSRFESSGNDIMGGDMGLGRFGPR